MTLLSQIWHTNSLEQCRSNVDMVILKVSLNQHNPYKEEHVSILWPRRGMY